ncbi:MAG TPA: AAA family ATPase, partial [Ktedonobacteraceae bacterium]
LLYAGDYLPEERHVEWTQTRRESLQRGWIGLLLELADLRIAREAIASAIDTLDRLLAIDPTNEAAVQRLILLLAQAGRRAEALRIYQRFAAILRQEYKMAPLQETRALYEAAQRGNSAALTLAAGPKLPATSAAHDGQTLEPEARPAMQVGRSNQSRLVGRDMELAALRQILVDTEQARRMKLAGQKKSVTSPALESGRRVQCVLLMGDVGIGKTRLAEEMGREASRRGWTVTWTRAYIQETSIPYRMWTETLRKAMTRGLWQRQEIARRPLIYQALRALLPELEDLLPPPDPSAVSPEQEQLRLWEAARALLATISESAPLMIVLDDLQWADSSSCELLAYLVRQLRQQPIVIVGTCRDIELPPSHPLRAVLNDLQREQSIEMITVQPLTDEQIRVLIAPLPEVVARHIQQRAAGNPFFAEELARNVSDTPLLASSSSASLDLPATMPDTIAAVLDLRLGRISNDCQRLLVRAAVLGGSFEFSALRALESGPAASDEDTLLDLLEEALQAGMLSEEGSGTRITYHFWHPLLVSHLYDGLSAGRRASLHRRAADALVRLYSDRAQESAAAIAYHLVNGGSDPTTIAHYAELAGDRAYALSAYPDAERYYRMAVEQKEMLSSIGSLDNHLHMANLVECLGECIRVQGKFEESRSYFERALNIRSQCNFSSTQFDLQYEAQIDALLLVEIGKTW